jgi:hypothetical protein
MEKIVTTLFDLLLNNKAATPLFTVLAGLVAIWAISGGAANVLGAPELKALEANHLKFKVSFEQCELVRLTTVSDLTLAQARVRQLENINELLQLMLANSGRGNIQLPDSVGKPMFHQSQAEGPAR